VDLSRTRVTVIPPAAFAIGHYLSEVLLPADLIEIGEAAFAL
jgi:hypothetical protein